MTTWRYSTPRGDELAHGLMTGSMRRIAVAVSETVRVGFFPSRLYVSMRLRCRLPAPLAPAPRFHPTPPHPCLSFHQCHTLFVARCPFEGVSTSQERREEQFPVSDALYRKVRVSEAPAVGARDTAGHEPVSNVDSPNERDKNCKRAERRAEKAPERGGDGQRGTRCGSVLPGDWCSVKVADALAFRCFASRKIVLGGCSQ